MKQYLDLMRLVRDEGVRKEYLETAFDEMETKYGTIEKYFSEGLGIDADQQKALRDLYLGLN